MKIIKLMADYHSYPLWWSGNNRFGNIDPKDLPISEELVDGLLLWAAFYDQTLNELECFYRGSNE